LIPTASPSINGATESTAGTGPVEKPENIHIVAHDDVVQSSVKRLPI
jgi:hypothetical protein